MSYNVLQTARFPSVTRPVIAPARLAKLWTTSFGTPVVPDVSRIHSVCSLARRSGAPGAMFAVQVTNPMPSAAGSATPGSPTTASTDAVAMIDGRCSGGRSGGHSTIRRATPSSSMSASAAGSWSFIVRSTERPRSSSSLPPRAEPPVKPANATPASALQIHRLDRIPAAFIAWYRETGSACGIFVELNEIPNRHWELYLFVRAERIELQRILKAGNDDGEAQRIEARLQETEIIG